MKNKNNSNGDLLRNPLSQMTIMVVGGVTIGVINDSVVNYIKANFAKTDYEKIYDRIYVSIKQGE